MRTISPQTSVREAVLPDTAFRMLPSWRRSTVSSTIWRSSSFIGPTSILGSVFSYPFGPTCVSSTGTSCPVSLSR